MRPVTTEDADELAHLEARVFPESNFNEYTLAKEIELGGGFVICDGWTIVAYMLLRGDSYLTDIMRLGVLPDYRGCGLGTQLLQQGFKQAQYVMLTVLAENTSALRLYHRHGFEIVGRLYEGAWVMGKSIHTGRNSYFIGLTR